MSHELEKMNFAIRLMEELPIAETTEGYDFEEWEESMMLLKMNINRAKKRPETIEKCYQMVISELRMYDIGCLACAYRDFMEREE